MTASIAPAENHAATAHERVYRALRARILAGEMAPGAALTLRGIAEDLGVSMTPAREAVRRLVAERALAMGPSGRVTVPVPDARTLDELFAARRLLEPELAVRALPNVDRRLVARLGSLDEAIDAAIAAGDAAAYVRANNAFHATLYARADSPALMALVESVWLQTAPMMRRVYGRLGTAALADYHGAALEALAARDPGALRAAIRQDIDQGAALLGQIALDGADL